MSNRMARELTSAEAGFYFAARRCGQGFDSGWTVDEITAGPLAKMIASADGGDDDEDVEAWLKAARFFRWIDRVGDEGTRDIPSALQRAARWLESDEASPPAAVEAARILVGRKIDEQGRDLSLWSEETFDIRRWALRDCDASVVVELIVVGAILLDSLERTTLRRRLAANLRSLPPAIGKEIRDGLAAGHDVSPELRRRVFEVYTNLAGQGLRPDEECALVGLFFVISAAVFRQNFAVVHYGQILPEKLADWVDRYRRACLRSGKPQLGPKIAELLRRIEAKEQVDE